MPRFMLTAADRREVIQLVHLAEDRLYNPSHLDVTSFMVRTFSLTS